MIEIHLVEEQEFDAQSLKEGQVGIAVRNSKNGFVRTGDLLKKVDCGIANILCPVTHTLTDIGCYFVRLMRPGEYLKATSQGVEIHLEEEETLDAMDLKHQEPGILVKVPSHSEWKVGDPIVKLGPYIYNLDKGRYADVRISYYVRKLREGEYVRFTE